LRVAFPLFSSLTVFFIFCSTFIFSNEIILINAVPKSASVYILEKIKQGLPSHNKVLPFCKPRAWGEQLSSIDERLLIKSLRENGIIRDHLFASDKNIELIKKYKMKMVLHVRDLRQQLLSLAHHYHRDIQKGVSPPPLGYTSDITIDQLIDYYNSIHLTEHFAQNILTWLEQRERIPMLITTYEEFHADEQAFIKRILDFYKIPYERFKNQSIIKNIGVHFRKGETCEWKERLSLEQIERINEQIPLELFDFFCWDR
jgi:hypothetical protein